MPANDDNSHAKSGTGLTAGTLVGHYRIIEKIGAGGMGEVYLAEDTNLNRRVALKFLPRDLCQDDNCRARFKREAQAAAKLSHPNIVTIFEVTECHDRPCIVMEYLQGKSLKEVIQAGNIPLAKAIDLTIQIVEGLHAAHQAGVVHRDIKPANIVVGNDGRARILDFGLATVRGSEHLTKTGTTLGTVAYMSPEHILGQQIDERSDIWSVGVLLYELLTGRLPFSGEHEAAIMYSISYEEPPSLSEAISPNLEEFQRVIARSLNKVRDYRYATAQDMLSALMQLREILKPSLTQPVSNRAWSQLLLRPVVLIPMILVLSGIAYVSYRSIQHNAKVRWAKGVVLPTVDSLANESKWETAYFLAKSTESYLHSDPLLAKLWPKFTTKISIRTNPADARVYLKEYAAGDDHWMYLGRTPMDSVFFPSGRCAVRVRIEKEGYIPLNLAVGAGYFANPLPIDLVSIGSMPPEMVPVRAGKVILDATGDSARLGDFLIDQYETTNRDYKEFVDAGGYKSSVFWKYPVIGRGRVLTWEQSMAGFVDATGRPGPSTWEMETYREGEGDHPVGGISWYEAAAYAEFRGKALPTVYHWNLAANTRLSRYIVLASNFSGKGPMPVGKGVSACGAYDMAGNVREWCFNKSGAERCVLGGGWNDPPYSFNDLYAQPPLDRSPTNGVRCMKVLKPIDADSLAYAPIAIAFRDFLSEHPVPDQVYRQYLSFYAYDHTPLQAHIESTDSTDEWISQKVSFDAAYGGERMMVYIILPKGARPPLQTVVYFPGSDNIYERSSSSERLISGIEFIVKGGRALAYPIFKGTFERGSKLNTDYPNETVLWRDHVVAWAKDIGRTIDYLGTRPDIDTSRIAYFGWSWGGMMGAIMPAVERRFKVVVLNVAGLSFNKTLPEVDAINFVGHIQMPVLMLNGKYDYYFPYETSQLPMFKLLGTPPDQKKQVVYETSHFLPRNQLIKEILNWFDEYLGKVQRP